jgi:hypothetical protein
MMPTAIAVVAEVMEIKRTMTTRRTKVGRLATIGKKVIGSTAGTMSAMAHGTRVAIPILVTSMHRGQMTFRMEQAMGSRNGQAPFLLMLQIRRT